MKYLELQLHRLRYDVRKVIADYPVLYLPLARLKSRGPSTQVVDDSTQILIEAWPRSGNTFAEQAFRMSQPGPVRLAHHFHAPAQVIAAVQRGLPTLVIVREPVDSIASFLIWDASITAEQALHSWIRFHERIMPWSYGYVTATFAQVTTDFGAVMQKLNERFDTSFGIFEHTPENVKKCFGTIESNYRQRLGNGEIVESSVARPSRERDDQKSSILAELNADKLAPPLERARQIYTKFAAWADHD